MYQVEVSSDADKVLRKWKKSNPQLWKKYQKIYNPESVIRILCILNLMYISSSCHSHFLSESWPHRSLNVARYVGERRCNQSSRNKDGL